MKNYFPERFSLLLSESDLKYEDIANKLNLKSKGTISKYASGKISNVTVSMIIKISRLFNVSPAWLIGFSNDRNCKIEYKNFE